VTALKDLGRVAISREAAGRVNEFVSAVRYLMIEKGGAAAKFAERNHAPERVVDFVKAAIEPGTTLTSNWGDPLSNVQNLSNAFLNSLVGVSVLDTLLPAMLQLPPRTTIVSVTTTLTGGTVLEAAVKPASQLSLAATDLEPVKVAAYCAVTTELLRMSTPGALELLKRELRIAITKATNTFFLSKFAGVPSFVSSGVTGTGFRQDLRTLLANVSSGAESKLYLLLGRNIAEALAVLQDSSGAGAFPLATVNGGSIGGIQIVVSDEVTSGEMILVDASQLAVAQEGFRIEQSNQASIQLNSTPDSPTTGSTVMTSLWQANMSAVRAERYVGLALIRSDCAAKITGIGLTGGSPA
jgi:HK97 family phage major capsid protein